MKAWKKDMILSITLLLLCAGGYLYCEALPDGLQQYSLARAGKYVQCWIVILAVLSAALLIRTLRKKPEDFVPSVWDKIVLLTLGALLAYLALMPYIGFFIATILFLFTLAVAYHQADKEKRLSGKALRIAMAKWLSIAVVLTVVLYLLFTVLLKAKLPEFRIFGL